MHRVCTMACIDRVRLHQSQQSCNYQDRVKFCTRPNTLTHRFRAGTAKGKFSSQEHVSNSWNVTLFPDHFKINLRQIRFKFLTYSRISFSKLVLVKLNVVGFKRKCEQWFVTQIGFSVANAFADLSTIMEYTQLGSHNKTLIDVA